MTTSGPSSEDAGLALMVERGAAGCAWVAARGELDLFTGPALRKTVGELIASGRTVITLDLTALSFLDSAGHRSIGSVADLAESLGGEVRLDGCSRQVRRFLELTRNILASAPRDGPTARPDWNGAGDGRPREVGF